MHEKEIPLYALADYSEAMQGAEGIYAGRFEVITERMPNRLRLHRHDYFEVFWVTEAGSHFNDFQEYVIGGPKFIFVSPGQVHRWRRGELLRGVSLGFTQGFFDGGVPPPSPLLKHHFWYPQDCPPVLDLPGEAAKQIEELCMEIEREFAGHGSRREDMMRALLRVLLIRADRLYERQHPEMGRTRRYTLVRDLRLALEQHFDTVRTVSGYAQLLGVSADYLGQVFREHTGRPVGDAIRQRVLLEAKRLLAYSKLNISEVAFALHFEDPAYFCRYFRRLCGQSPGEFRATLTGMAAAE